MDQHDLDRWARLVASSCTRRQTLRVLAAGAMALGLGRRARFEALAADLGCCKCSGTLRCELDVASYGECVTVCGPRRQAIFAPNYTCTRGNSLNKVCKPKRRARGAALLAGTPGVFDLAFVDRAGAATIPGLSPVTTEALFTAEAAVAAGIVGEAGAAVLFERGVQVYHSLWQDAGDTIAVVDHLSQHLTADAAANWYEYALAQLGPDGAETFELDLSGIDAGALVRFAFPSQTRPGATITRLMAITLTGEFVNWVGIDGVDTVPDPEIGRTFAQAAVNALIDRPEQTASLTPYVTLLPGAAACLPEFPFAAAKRAGASAARGAAGLQDEDVPCVAPAGNVRYTVWDGAYVPVLDAPAPLIELNQTFFDGADRVLNQSYAVGDQTWTSTIAHWTDPDVLANDGEVFFARRAVADDTRQLLRRSIGSNPEGAFTVLSYLLGEQTISGIDRVVIAPPYSVSLGVVQPGEPLADQASGTTNGAIPADPNWRAVMDQLEAEAGRRKSLFDLGVYSENTPVFADAWFSEDSPPQGDEVVSGPGRRDFGAAMAALERSPHMAGFGSDPENGITYFAAKTGYGGDHEAFAPAVIGPLFNEHGLIQVRVNQYFTEGAAESLRLDQYQFPDRTSAEAGFDVLAGALAQRGQADLTVEFPGQPRSFTVRSNVAVDDREAVRHETVVLVGEIVVTATYDVVNPQTDPTERLTGVLTDLLVAYNPAAWAGPVGVAVHPVTPWMPWMTGVVEFQDDLIVVDGVSYGDDPDRTAAANPGVLTARVGGYRIPIPGEIDIQWGARSFVDPTVLANYLGQLPDLRPEINWFTRQPLEQLAEFPHVVYCVTTQPADGVPFVGAYVAIQAEETIVFDFAALVPFTGDATMLAEHDPTTDPNFAPLSSGIASIYLALDDYVKNSTPPVGFYGDPKIEPPPIWFELTPGGPIVEAGGEVDPTLLRDFGATAATFGLSSALSGYQVTGGETLLTREAMEAALQAWADRASPDADKEEIVKLYFGDQEPMQVRFDQFATDDESETVELIQVQYPTAPTWAAWLNAPAALGGWASGSDPSELSNPDGDASGLTWQAEFEVEEEVADTTYLLVVDEKVVAVVTSTTKRDESSNGAEENEEWAEAVFEDLDAAYAEDDWAGDVGEAVHDVTRWMPAPDAQTQWYFHHYYGVVDGQPLPRFGDDPDRIAAENPWVRNALFGGYGVNSGLGAIDVSFGVRSFADQSDADNYFAQLPSLMEDDRFGVTWRLWDEIDPGFDRRYLDRYLAYGGAWGPAEGGYRVGAYVVIQDGKIVYDLTAFVPHTGDPGTIANLDPLAGSATIALAKGLVELLMKQDDERAVTEVPRGYLRNPGPLPASWQGPVVPQDSEAAASQLDPVAWVGNVALALPGFETTPLAFVYDPQHERAAPAFYGAAPPEGWQGLARTSLFRPNPDAPNGQGFDLALYLYGHWFDTAANARAWYLAGKPLVEAAGNGTYVEQTGEADFGIQRTIWGASFPTPDNPDLTIQRVIGWVRRGVVVVQATLDAYCAGAAGTGAFCGDGVVPYFQEELGQLIDDGLKTAETGSTVTGNLPVIPGTQVVQANLTQWGDQAINEYGDSAEQRALGEEFNLGANVHVTLQYVGPTDADGTPAVVFGNSWVTDSFIETQEALAELARVVEASDARIGGERVDVPRLALSGEGWAITGNAFVFAQADGTKVGGPEIYVANGTKLDTAAMVTQLPPGTTAQDVAADFEQRIAAAAQDPEGTRDASVAVLVAAISLGLGARPSDVLEAVANGCTSGEAEPDEDEDEDEDEGARQGAPGSGGPTVIDYSEVPDLSEISRQPGIGEPSGPAVGSFLGIGSDDPADGPPVTMC